jgi:urease alpha subunit
MKTLSPEEVCYVPDDLVEEGQERKLQKVSKFNDVVVYEGDDTVDDDFDFAQDTIRETIMKSNEVLQELGQAAILNENGKLYESYSQLMKNIIDGSAQLIDIHGKKKKIKEVKEPKQKNTQVNNLIVGSTKELLEMIESNK